MKIMNVGLIDLDGKFPNLALMKISAYHKQNGDSVDFATIGEYDKLFIERKKCFILIINQMRLIMQYSNITSKVFCFCLYSK
jgi:hypothetical protein